MTRITVKTHGSSITAQATGKLTNGMVGVPVNIEYDSAWDGLIKTAVFKVGSFARDRRNIEAETTVPWEVMRYHGNPLQVGIEGRGADGNIVMPTVWATVGIIHRGANATIPGAANPEHENGDFPASPTSAVLYTPQNLTPEEKAQARENIGAASTDDYARLSADIAQVSVRATAAVSYAFEQSLTDAQKEQARRNIGTASMEELQAYIDETILGGEW